MTNETLPADLRRPRFRRDAACKYLAEIHGLQFSVATLKAYATRGIGPSYEPVNRTPYYAAKDLDAWASSILIRRRTAV